MSKTREDMARKGWYEALKSALQKEKETVMQLATIDASGKPHVRSHIWRAFLTTPTLPSLPLLLTTTDVRTPKVTQMASRCENADPTDVEVVFWTPSTVEQFRIHGRAWIVPEPNYDRGTYPLPGGMVYEALKKEGFDWEAKRREVFDGMSRYMKATWCRPVPGTPLESHGGEEEMKRWPTTLPKLDETTSGEERRDLETALSNFALLLVEPIAVDYLELGVFPNRRTRFERDSERSVEWKETPLVP